MTAICKTIEIHGGLSHLLDYGADTDKTSLKNHDLQNTLDYAKNPLKTILELDDGDKSLLVTGILCTPETAEEEFSILREKYQETHGREYAVPFSYKDKKTGKTKTVQKIPVTAIHLIQSFSETDLDPRTVHQIGVELCERMGWQAVVDTHMNTGHCHNHIIINAYLPDGNRKVSMNQKNRMEIRTVSDEIQRDYGIDVAFMEPEQQLKHSTRSLNYREWDMQKKGLSWKDQIRRDMLSARHVSETRGDFIRIMQSYGYSIERQTADSILWWNRQHTKKIWDRTLGEEYKVENLMREDDPAETLSTEQEREEARHQTKYISVSRYTWDGCRRSDIELLIRKAIAIIQKVRTFYEKYGTSYDYRPSIKLEMMQEAINQIHEQNIDTVQALQEKMDAVGAELNHTKKELRTRQAQKSYYDNISKLVSEYEAAKTVYDSVKFWSKPHSNLHPITYTRDEIQQNRADLMPITPLQKRELYQAMKKHPNLRLRNAMKGYRNISSVDAEQVLRYFSGKCEKPDILITSQESYQLRFIQPSDNTKPSTHRRKATCAFKQEISFETPRKQTVLSQLRNRQNALHALGYDPDHIDAIKTEINDFFREYADLSEKKQGLSASYKGLIRIKQQLTFADSEQYLYGPLLQPDNPSQSQTQNLSLEPPSKDRQPDQEIDKKSPQPSVSKSIRFDPSKSPDDDIPL